MLILAPATSAANLMVLPFACSAAWFRLPLCRLRRSRVVRTPIALRLAFGAAYLFGRHLRGPDTLQRNGFPHICTISGCRGRGWGTPCVTHVVHADLNTFAPRPRPSRYDPNMHRCSHVSCVSCPDEPHARDYAPTHPTHSCAPAFVWWHCLFKWLSQRVVANNQRDRRECRLGRLWRPRKDCSRRRARGWGRHNR